MKHLLLFAALLLFGGVASRARTSPAKPMNAVGKEVEALERQRFEAQVKKDYAFFGKSLCRCHATGALCHR